MVHISSLSLGSKITIHPARKTQIALLLAKKVTVLANYLDFTDVFSKKLAEVLLEQIEINKHAIELEKGNQSSYGPIYSLEPIKLKEHKTYIKTNLTNGFIKILKLLVIASILFLRKPNSSFYIYFNYQGPIIS